VEKLSQFFYDISLGWVALAGVLILVLFGALFLPGQTQITQAYSKGSGSPDTSLFYSSKELYQMAHLYGEEGRQSYLRARWTFDLAFPVVYSFFLVTSISWLLARLTTAGTKWRLLNLVPAGAFVLDLLENISTSLVMASYPVHCPPGELLAPVFTPIKWLLVSASFVVLMVAFASKVVAILRKRMRK